MKPETPTQDADAVICSVARFSLPSPRIELNWDLLTPVLTELWPE